MSDVDIMARDLFECYIRTNNILTQDIMDNHDDRISLMISRDAYRAVINSMAHLHGFTIVLTGDGYIMMVNDESTLTYVQ